MEVERDLSRDRVKKCVCVGVCLCVYERERAREGPFFSDELLLFVHAPLPLCVGERGVRYRG